MRSFGFVAIAVASGICIAGARAADLPPDAVVPTTLPEASPFSWAGFHVGFHLGGGWGDQEAVLDAPPGFSYPEIDKISAEGLLGGVQAGYSWQAGSFVFGVEADASAFDADDSDVETFLDPQSGDYFGDGLSSDYEFLATLRGRAGLAFGRGLVYGTGGLALGSFEDSYLVFFEDVGGFTESNRTDDDETAVGWTAGGGIELALGDRFSVRGEALYVDLGENDVDASVGFEGAPAEGRIDHEFGIARIGFNAHF